MNLQMEQKLILTRDHIKSDLGEKMLFDIIESGAKLLLLPNRFLTSGSILGFQARAIT